MNEFGGELNYYHRVIVVIFTVLHVYVYIHTCTPVITTHPSVL